MTRDDRSVGGESYAPGPFPVSEAVRKRFQRQRQRDTACEIALRRLLHEAGMRYRVGIAPVRGLRRRADIVFPGAKLAIFVDGCFWHGCTEHRTVPKNNRGWWQAKIDGNRARDRDTDERLAAEGWLAVRIWEHDSLDEAVARISSLVDARRTQSRRRV